MRRLRAKETRPSLPGGAGLRPRAIRPAASTAVERQEAQGPFAKGPARPRKARKGQPDRKGGP